MIRVIMIALYFKSPTFAEYTLKAQENTVANVERKTSTFSSYVIIS